MDKDHLLVCPKLDHNSKELSKLYTSNVSPCSATLRSPTHGDHRTGHHRYQNVAVIQYASHGTPTSHTHHPHHKTPTPHELFHLPRLEETHPHLHAESPATNHARDNKSRTSRAEDNSINGTCIPLNFFYCLYKQF
jgi:hypothetical protein